MGLARQPLTVEPFATDAGQNVAMAQPASAAVAELLTILDLERIEENIFRGRSPQVGWQRVFGGLVIAQALVASARTVPYRAPHSLHGYFLLPGDPRAPIIYEVDRLRDGKSFTTRRCNAIQHGRAIFSLSASFQIEEPGLEHAVAMPDVPPPETLPSEAEIVRGFGAAAPEPIRRWFASDRPIETRPVDPSRYIGHDAGAPAQNIWLRATGPLPDDPAIHRAVLAYLSDMTLLDTALMAHGHRLSDTDLQIASLDHALWFHRPFRADDWLLYVQDSPNSGGARGLTRGLLFSRDGRLVASVIQEGLMRQRPKIF
jgi:acyl-CoA thioesterase-2